ncbi:MAG: PTS transporter subunit EIIC [Bacteroidales bacterium]|nr:PTS transporter subunit EIIC [Bacteroidales bacterium]
MANNKHSVSAFLQSLGKSLMLPVACLPVAGILIGIGYWLAAWDNIAVVANFLLQAGQAIINHIPLLFAIGIAVGMSDDQHGVSALSGLISWLVITALLSPESVASLRPGISLDAFAKSENVFIAIISGLIGAWSYNRFKNTDLPEALAFFSGKRSVAIVSAGISSLVALVLLFAWPLLYNALIALGKSITSTGAIGAGIYVFLNRLLIPFGLHHALNQVFWFDLAGINDLGNFWSGQGTLGQTGMYMSGFFPMMMFALPAAALAMYHSALPSQKKKIGALMLAGAISSFFTGVTEPLEFSFMFTAPLLYLLHALLSGLGAFVVALLPIRVGFNFSAGLVDFLLCLKSPMTLNPWGIWLIGLGMAVVYYLLFRLCIKVFRLKTPGRDTEEASHKSKSPSHKAEETAKTSSLDTQADIILQALGGKANIRQLDHCTTRLRIELNDLQIVDQAGIKATKVNGIIVSGENSLQIVVGPKVQFLAESMKARLAQSL